MTLLKDNQKAAIQAVSEKKNYIAKNMFQKIGIKGCGKLQDSYIISVKSFTNTYF
jgi:hypothetical protein